MTNYHLDYDAYGDLSLWKGDGEWPELVASRHHFDDETWTLLLRGVSLLASPCRVDALEATGHPREHIRPEPTAFQPGDRVRDRAVGILGTVVSGPFQSITGGTLFTVEWDYHGDSPEPPKSLELISRPEPTGLAQWQRNLLNHHSKDGEAIAQRVEDHLWDAANTPATDPIGTIDEQIHDALAHADVNVCEILPPVVAYPCTWCQDIGAVCSVTVYWTPRADVLSDGYAECCRDCAPERIRLALDDSLAAARVTVEIIGGEQ